MAIRFDSALLSQDLETFRKRKRLSLHKVSQRTGVHQTTLSSLRSGIIKDITVTTLARIVYFLGDSDISKYIYNDGEN